MGIRTDKKIRLWKWKYFADDPFIIPRVPLSRCPIRARIKSGRKRTSAGKRCFLRGLNDYERPSFFFSSRFCSPGKEKNKNWGISPPCRRANNRTSKQIQRIKSPRRFYDGVAENRQVAILSDPSVAIRRLLIIDPPPFSLDGPINKTRINDDPAENSYKLLS